jgi:hypothetical protein
MDFTAIEMDNIDPTSDWIVEHGDGPEDTEPLFSEELM